MEAVAVLTTEQIKSLVVECSALGFKEGYRVAKLEEMKPEDPEELIKLEDVALIIKRSIYTVRERIKLKNKDRELIPVEQWPENKHYQAIRRKYIKDIDGKLY
jgi:hypothetical protein